MASCMAIALTMTGMTAQDDNKLTLEDLIPGGERYVAHIPENIYGLQWCGDVCIKPGIDTLYAIDPADGRTTILATRDDVNRALAGTDGSKMSAFYYSPCPELCTFNPLTTPGGNSRPAPVVPQTSAAGCETGGSVSEVQYTALDACVSLVGNIGVGAGPVSVALLTRKTPETN